MKPYATLFTDRAEWLKQLRAFVLNERPVAHTYTPTMRGLRPAAAIAPQPGFVDLVRLHYQEGVDYDGGDVIVESRVLTDISPCYGSIYAKVALKYQWTSPASYTMTLIFVLPRNRVWLQSVARAGGFHCGAAPLRPNSGMLWLPMNDDTAQHLALLEATYTFIDAMPAAGGRR